LNKTTHIDDQHILFVFINQQILVSKTHNVKEGLAELSHLPNSLQTHLDDKQSLVVTSEYGKHYLLDLHHVEFEHDDYELLSLRELLMGMPTADFAHVAQAWQYALFLRTHRYCGRCANTLRKVTWEMAMHCDKCSHRVYPRVSPCIIVAIHDDRRILLAQGVRQKGAGFYSTLAGFVESAENLEQAVHREVFEEVGVKVKDVEYFGSQPWPFPHSLMVGYIAKFDSGDIRIDEKEIIDAQWFDIDDLPVVPPTVSIAGRLIDETISRIKKTAIKNLNSGQGLPI
jgi:NAD+ diphosphatase